MTVNLIEGFDHMSTVAKFGTKGWLLTQVPDAIGTNDTVSLVSGRFAGQAYRVQKPAGGSFHGETTALSKNLPGTYTQFVIGFAFRMSALPTAAASIIQTTGNAVQVYIETNGKVSIRNSAGTAIATGNFAFALNAWNYIEVKAVINGASGSCATQINGAVDIATTTGNFGSTGISAVALFAAGQNTVWPSTSTVQLDWDDVYFLDTSASPNNNFLGDVSVQTIYPSADGASTQWTPNSGSPHFSRVNESSSTFPDDDTSYVSDSVVGDRDSYAFGDLTSTAGAIYAVQTNVYARKDDAGTKQLAAVVRRSATNYDGATATLSVGYADYTEIRETDPSTAVAWTVSGVNAAEFGLKVVT